MNIAGTMLNICAILSSLKQHREAVSYAQSCLSRAEEVLHQLDDKYPVVSGDSGSDFANQHPPLRDKFQLTAYKKNVYTTMVIALYNLGVEHEHLHDYA